MLVVYTLYNCQFECVDWYQVWRAFFVHVNTFLGLSFSDASAVSDDSAAGTSIRLALL